MQILLESLQTSLLGLLPIHMRPRISQFLKLLLAQPLVRRVYRFPLDILQLGDPFADIITTGIIPLSLGHRIEDRIARFPSLRVVAEIPIDEVFSEPALAAAIVEQEVTVEVAADVHAQSIVHVCFRVQLSHACVDKGHASGAFIPFLPAFLVLLPVDLVEIEVLREVHGAVGHHAGDLTVELSEDDFAHPGANATTAGVEVFALVELFRSG